MSAPQPEPAATKDVGILFSAPMVRAILAGTKTQTRRALKPQPAQIPPEPRLRWAAGNTLWVRETWAYFPKPLVTIYRADFPGGERVRPDVPWRPAIHMTRWRSRIKLSVESVHVERLQDISEADAMAEGCSPAGAGAIDAYARLWDDINGHCAWAANPWVAVIKFRRMKP